jgi:hypothetical protein
MDKVNLTRRTMLLFSALMTSGVVGASTPPSAPGSAGGISDPLKIRQVKLVFGYGGVGLPRRSFSADQPIAGFSATLYYSGAGTVSGRWEVVVPGDPLPTALHLLPDFDVPALTRSNLEKYKVVDTFIENFAPIGRHVIPGPDTKKLPRDRPGIYKVLLRVDSISSITEQNPAQHGLVIPFLQYTIQGVSTR